jgi:hypothetical protein
MDPADGAEGVAVDHPLGGLTQLAKQHAREGQAHAAVTFHHPEEVQGREDGGAGGLDRHHLGLAFRPGLGRQLIQPPSMMWIWPVVKLDSSLARPTVQIQPPAGRW